MGKELKKANKTQKRHNAEEPIARNKAAGVTKKSKPTPKPVAHKISADNAKDKETAQKPIQSTQEEQEDVDDIQVTFEDNDDEIVKAVDSSEDENEQDLSVINQPDVFKSNSPVVTLSNKKMNDQIHQKIQNLKSQKKSLTADIPAVVYLGRIPHGFYEKEMRNYFSQFGTISRLRLSRNKKTGKSKHFAFIEFESQDVARIVAETMDNYLISNHILKCKVIESGQLHKDTFKGANKKFTAIPWQKVERMRHNREKTQEQTERIQKKLIEKENAKREKMHAMGISYDFPGYAACSKVVA